MRIMNMRNITPNEAAISINGRSIKKKKKMTKKKSILKYVEYPSITAEIINSIVVEL